MACSEKLEIFHKFYERIKSKHCCNYRGVFVKCETFENESLINVDSLDSNEQIDIEETTVESLNPLSSQKFLQESKTRRPVRDKNGIDKIQKDLCSRKVVTPIDEQKILSSIDMRCDLCNIPLESFKVAVIHHRKHHKQKGYLMCCSRKFLQRTAFVRHLEIHSNQEQFRCQLREKNFSCHSNLHTQQTQFQCDVCGKFVYCKNRLTVHLKIHFNIKKSAQNFACSEKDCEKIYQSQYGLKTHIRNCHNQKRDTFSCEICGKQLMSRSSLKDHVENTHADNIVKIRRF